MIEVSRESRGGAVVVFWKSDFDFSVDTFSSNHIDAIVNKGKEDAWRFTGFYGEPDTGYAKPSYFLGKVTQSKS